MINRLKAMEPREILWRVEQKQQQREEYKSVYSLHKTVIEMPLSKEIADLHIDLNRLSINWENKEWTAFENLDLFGAFTYKDYRNRWNAGFQTENSWPEEPYSPTISTSRRVDIGDIRTNWELNRHFQFAALAKSYYCTKDKKYIVELEELFEDWNRRNLFLHGVEWISAMEIAIRVNSWVYTLAFLKKAGTEGLLTNQLEHGVLVMTDYIFKHHARFSSANNHLIVEMYAVALVGILTDYAPWKDAALNIFTEELPVQNYCDGVNKEMSLHYQSFVMEAYGFIMILMMKNQIPIPDSWSIYLTAMTEFLADSIGDYGETVEFGDSDDGKILDLAGKVENHYQYVLNLMSALLDKRYTISADHENLLWIVPSEMLDARAGKARYVPCLVCSRKEGGYTILRSKDRRVLIGIDHADLGFGSIAAHGHADALSFQMYIEGQPVFVDAGTYNYHITPEDRDYFRSTRAHNTVVIGDTDQSEMLGPFIWGKRANAELISIEQTDDEVCLTARCKTVYGIHTRTFNYDFESRLRIRDTISNENGELILHIAPKVKVTNEHGSVIGKIGNLQIQVMTSGDPFRINESEYSPEYNHRYNNTAVTAQIIGEVITEIEWKEADEF